MKQIRENFADTIQDCRVTQERTNLGRVVVVFDYFIFQNVLKFKFSINLRLKIILETRLNLKTTHATIKKIRRNQIGK
jgi:hypothetical protein